MILKVLGVLRVRVRLLLDKLLLFVHNWFICMHDLVLLDVLLILFTALRR